MNISSTIVDRIRGVASKLPFMVCTPQMMAWASAKAKEEEDLFKKRLLEACGGNPDGTARNVSSDLSNSSRAISAEQLSTFIQQLTAESEKYRRKARRTKSKNGKRRKAAR